MVLKNILQNENNLNKISLAFGNQSVELNDLSFEAPAITSKCVLCCSKCKAQSAILYPFFPPNLSCLFYIIVCWIYIIIIYMFWNLVDITELKPFINCTQFANYTAEIINRQWQCVGPCKRNPDYCNGHGQCLNDIYTGSVCR